MHAVGLNAGQVLAMFFFDSFILPAKQAKADVQNLSK